MSLKMYLSVKIKKNYTQIQRKTKHVFISDIVHESTISLKLTRIFRNHQWLYG